MTRKPLLALTIGLAALVAAAPAAAGAHPSTDPVAAAAKKKHRNRNKKAKRPQAAPGSPLLPAAPATPPERPTPPGPPDPPDPSDPPPPPPPPPGCPGEDAAENDDTLLTATVVPGTGSTNLSRFRCPEDSDFFKLTVPAGTWISFTVRASGWDPAIVVYDENGQQLEVVDIVNSYEYLELDNDTTTPMTRYLEVTGSTSGASGAYDVETYES